MKHRLAIFILLLFCLCLTGCAAQLSWDEEPAALFQPPAEPSGLERGVPQFNREEHLVYMSPLADGSFQPEGLLTRGEAAQMLYLLLNNPLPGRCSFSDISPVDACYEAVAGLTAWGVISDSSGAFRPDDLISRAQLFTMLKAFCPLSEEENLPYVGSFLRRQGQFEAPAMLPGVASYADISGHWAQAAIESAVALGWLDPGGAFGPDVAVTRAEFCRTMNRVLGRCADEGTILVSGDFSLYSDVPADHPAFADIMEASCAHDYELQNGTEVWLGHTLEPGFHRLLGRLYYVDENGQLLRNARYRNWDFDANGRYTTGLAEADALLAQVLQELGTDDMSDYEALRAVYSYCVWGHSYIRAPWIGSYPDYDRLEHAYRALRFFTNGGGNCYDYASAFGLLARSLGYNAYIVQAQINEFYADHSWVVIPEDGVNFIYDPEMESTRARHYGFDLFRIYNHSIYHYWYDPWW